MGTTPQSSFSNIKDLKFTFTLGQGTFDGSSNTLTVQGLRATVDIDLAGGSMYGHLVCNIYGMTLSDMNAIASYQYQPDVIVRNQIQVTAIDGDQSTLVFTGTIMTAWPNFQNPPDVYLQIQASLAIINQLTPISPTSVKAPVDVATVMQQLATTGGYTFENNLTAPITLSSTYLTGTMIDQARELANTAQINFYIHNGVLAITPLNTPRVTPQPIPLVSSATGMVGYPVYDGQLLFFRTLFNRQILFGGAIQVVLSSIPQKIGAQDQLNQGGTVTAGSPSVTPPPPIQTPQGAAGQWYVSSVAYSLESQKPNGAWFCSVSARAIQLPVTS